MKNARLLLGYSLLFFACQLWAQNPICPTGMYLADPEAHVAIDGRLYIYGSVDENDAYWCSHSYDVYSSQDLNHWNIDKGSFSSVGSNDQVPYTDELLFAPDCAYYQGTYYLYYCSPGKVFGEGVATSKHPAGPFTNGQQIEDLKQIDPAVLIDKDTAYFYWGQGQPKVARMNADMKSLDKNTIHDCLAGDKKENFFHEGSSIRKIGDTYYLVYADESRRGRPTCLGYATSKHPMGPFTYRGVIIDNFGCDPEVWNNHGSIEQVNGQWYVFYHRSSNRSRKFRKACLEPITINPDGSIDEVEMTSQGALPYLSAYQRTEAEWAAYLQGTLFVSDTLDQHGLLTEATHDNSATYSYLEFGEGATQMTLKTMAAPHGGTVEVRLDHPQGPLLGKGTVPPAPKGQNYQITQFPVTKIGGRHKVLLLFHPEKEHFPAIDWFQFEQ